MIRAPEDLAMLFHAIYETMAPSHGYKTRDESRVEWEALPEANRSLMVAVCSEVLDRLEGHAVLGGRVVELEQHGWTSGRDGVGTGKGFESDRPLYRVKPERSTDESAPRPSPAPSSHGGAGVGDPNVGGPANDPRGAS